MVWPILAALFSGGGAAAAGAGAAGAAGGAGGLMGMLGGGGAAAAPAVGSAASDAANMGMGMGSMSNILGQQATGTMGNILGQQAPGGGGMMPKLDTSAVMGNSKAGDMGGGFGSLTEGGVVPEETSWMDRAGEFMKNSGGEGSAVGGEMSGTDMSGYNGIAALKQMSDRVKRERSPRGRMKNINNTYLQGLMGG